MDIKLSRAAPLARALLGIGVLLGASHAVAAEYWLCAKAGSVNLPGGTAVPIWGYVQDDNANLADGCPNLDLTTWSAAKPALIVPAGDTTLTVHLRNDLTLEPTSIVIPGQTAVMVPVKFTDPQGRQRVRSFTHEAAAGGIADYSWSNVRPGTYLYHSGTHPQAQVQMGLYGALTKNFAAGPNQAYDGVHYDAEVTLLFSEIDPAQHAAIAAGTFGTANAPATTCIDTNGTPMPMTSALCYKPKYFLINGKPFQAGAPALATVEQGQTTLLRLLNAGSRAYVPLIQGTHMKMIAEDGNRYQYRVGTAVSARDQYQYSTWLAALKTTDAIIAPTAVGSYPIYDRRLNTVNSSAQDGGIFGVLLVAAPAPNLVVGVDDGTTTVARGQSNVTYTITVTNSGTATVTNATLTDTLPGDSRFTVTAWSCTATSGTCTATGTGNVTRGGSVSLDPDGTATYTLVGNIPAGAPLGNSTNAVTITAPVGVTESNLTDNTATDVNTITQPPADLAVVQNSDGRDTVPAGTLDVPYTIVVANNGPTAVNSAPLTVTLPGSTRYTVTSWVCTATSGSCTATGTGNTTRGGSVSLPSGATATYTLRGNIPVAAPLGVSTNRVAIGVPGTVTDPNTGNNVLDDTTTIATSPPADLVLAQNSDGLASVARGTTGVTYTIVVTNTDPANTAIGTLTDTLPGGSRFTVTSWTCTATSGLCTATGTGNAIRSGTVNLPPGASATYTLVGNIPIAAPLTGTSTNAVTVTGTNDPNGLNNSLSDTTVVTRPVAFTAESGPASLNAVTAATRVLSFGNQSSTVSDTVTLTNTTGTTVSFGTADVANGGANTNFSKGVNSCSGSILAAGQTCTIEVLFVGPAGSSSRTGTLTVPYTGATGSPALLSLTGS